MLHQLGDDPILSTKNQKILPFYIGDGTARTKFFSSLKAENFELLICQT